jgi:tyrosine-protein kinase Etk/Wzc
MAAAMVVLAVLSVWPRHYEARAELLPDDAGSVLSSLLGSASGGTGGLLSLGSLLNNKQSIESDLTIARSQVVLDDVVRRLHQEGRLSGDLDRATIKLRHKVDMEAVRGSILRVTVVDRDPVFAKAVVTDFVAAIRTRVGAITIEQAAQKKAVAVNRLGDASIDLERSQAALDRFRAENKLAAPEIQLGAAVSLVTELQAKLDAEEAQLRALQRFATGNNFQIQAAQAQVSALQAQIADAQASKNTGPGPSVGGLTPKITEYENLFRNERFAEAEYEIYERYLGTVTVEELAAGINMDLVEPPFVDPDRRYNTPAVAALAFVILLSVLAEFYIAQPVVGRRETAYAP